ncbi:MAG: hypothetical protein Q8O67_24360 [Deltaproteobacteria bacterium]|nr:hypothetical protein [Deltaproteobacteria bacterium]
MNIPLGLRLAALWNLLAATGAVVMTEVNLELFFKLDSPQPPGVMLVFYSLWVMVLALGVAYAVAAVAPRFREGILVVGAIGKSSIFLVWAAAFVQGSGTPLLLVGGIGDLLWAAWFVWILRSTKAL